MENSVKIAAAHAHQGQCIANVRMVSLVNFAIRHALNGAMEMDAIP
jgi:hypothetical protein